MNTTNQPGTNPRKTEIIAEFCQNHNGDFGLLKEMIHAAAESGATVGKMQTVFADRVTFRPQFEEGLVRDGVTHSIKRPYQPEYERLKGLEISLEQQREFVAACRAAGLEPMTTCFSRDLAEPIAQTGIRQIKVASYDCASFPMLRELKGRFDRVLVSTGATFDDEIRHAASILKGTDFALLHCVTIYPTPLDQMHLRRMDFLRELAPQVGFSDHSLVTRDGVVASKVAIHMGASVIERHFTILPPDKTKDGPVSITPAQLRELVAFAAMSHDEQKRQLDGTAPGWEKCLGLKIRALSDAELLNRDYYRGRFASRRPESRNGRNMIYNWEELPLS